MEIKDKTRLLEIVSVILTALGKFIFMNYLNWRLFYVSLVIILWSSYIIIRIRKQPNLTTYWGFRIDNFSKTIKLMLPFTLFGVICFFIVGYLNNTINITWHIIPILITYPLWGSIQQFLTIALLAGNLKDFKTFKLKNNIIILITALLFSAVHYPSNWLMLGTFILALFYGWAYLKQRNIFAMGLVHGWLGALFYYTVVNTNPFEDIFLKLVY